MAERADLPPQRPPAIFPMHLVYGGREHRQHCIRKKSPAFPLVHLLFPVQAKSIVPSFSSQGEDNQIVKMVDESTNEDFEAPTDEVSEIITDLVAGTAIPAPVRRNFLKAFGQLCAAAIDMPLAYLTGIADERRAETTARVKLINLSAAQIAQQMKTDPEYARVAVQKFGHRVLREQVNLDMITQRAATEIHKDSDFTGQSSPENSRDPINDDWLNAFEIEARQKSTEEMQAYFGKVLAGEIKNPGSYSTRTIKILGSLDHNIANHFSNLSSMCISTDFQDIRVCSMGGDAGQNTLQEYGLNFATLNLLNEHGLVISDYNSWREHMPCVAIPDTTNQTICIPLSFQGQHWILVPISNDKRGKKLRLHGVALTQAGKELTKIVKIAPIQNYFQELARFFKKEGFRMTEVDNAKPRVVTIKDVSEADSQ